MADFTLTDSADTFPSQGEDTSGDDRIRGLRGNDRLDGGAGNDFIDGGSDVDTLLGGFGNDTLDAGILPTTDVLDGGGGTDLAELDYQSVINVATQVSVRVIAVFGAGTWSTIIDGVTGVSLTGVERIGITSGNANDSLVGGDLADTLTSLRGNDTIRGGGGNDDIAKTQGRYTLDGGAGWDTLRVAGLGTPGNDALVFDARPATGTIACGTATSGTFKDFERFFVAGTSVGDTIHTRDGGDLLDGGDGADGLFGGGGRDTLEGGLGRDTLDGGAGDDSISGGVSLTGPAATPDQIFGGTGNDTITVDPGNTSGPTSTFAGLRVDGGSGTDTLVLAGGSQPMDLSGATLSGVERLVYSSSGFIGSVALRAGQFNMLSDFQLNSFLRITSAGNLVADGALGVTEIQLFAGGQRLDLSGSTRPSSPDFGPRVTGGAGNDEVIGSARRDYFLGLGGNDTLSGGGGADELVGGAGSDRMAGGAGGDTFTFVSTGDSGTTAATRDVITGFAVAAGGGATFVDRLSLSFIDAKAGTPLNDAFTFIGSAAFSGAAQVRAIQSGADTLVLVNTAGTATAEMQILLQGFSAASLTAADFVL